MMDGQQRTTNEGRRTTGFSTRVGMDVNRRIVLNMVEFRGVLLTLTFCLFLAACDSTFVDPFEGQQKYFTVYGVLQSTETEHYIRVVPIRRTMEEISEPRDPQAKIDAHVASTDLVTGEVYGWSHRLVPLNDGNYGHVFSANFLVFPRHTYRLEIKRSNGATTVAETTVPNPEDISIVPDPPRMEGDSLIQTVYFEHLDWPYKIDIVYEVGFGMSVGFRRILYGRVGQRTEQGWQIDINLSRDAARLKNILDIADDQLLPLASIDARIEIPDEQWTPSFEEWTTLEDWDPIELVQPGVLSNVKNGYGFWGSTSVTNSQRWTLTEEAARSAGFEYIPTHGMMKENMDSIFQYYGMY